MAHIQESIPYVVLIKLVLLLFVNICCMDTTLADDDFFKCPIGFKFAEDKQKDFRICYQEKGPEAFNDKFKDCAGNKFSLKLHTALGIPKSKNEIWTDYKAWYPGGLFMDFYSRSGEVLDTSYEVSRDAKYGDDEKLCVIIDPVTNFTAVRCDEEYYRYCFVEPFETNKKYITSEGCEDDFWRYWSPKPACLFPYNNSRTPWTRLEKSCGSKKSNILNQGWIYSNHQLLKQQKDDFSVVYPLDVKYDKDDNIVQYRTYDDPNTVDTTGVEFIPPTSDKQTRGAVNNTRYYSALIFLDKSFNFNSWICEKPVHLKDLEMKLEIDDDNRIILKVNELIDIKHIFCFYDSNSYHLSEVKNVRNETKTRFVVSPVGQPGNGYYWCTHDDTTRFTKTISNDVLYMRVKEDTRNLYAVKITMETKYKLHEISNLLEEISDSIKEYVKYSASYLKLHTGPDDYNNRTIMDYKAKAARESLPNIEVTTALRRLYLDARTMLLQVKLEPNDEPSAQPGLWAARSWGGFYVQYMRPVYYCPHTPDGRELVMGERVKGPNCKQFKCEDDYMNGVFLLETLQDSCTITDTTPAINTTVTILRAIHSSDSDSSEESATTSVDMPQMVELPAAPDPPPPATVSAPPKPTRPPPTTPDTTVTTEVPTTPPNLPPEAELDHLLDELDSLVDGTHNVTTDDVLAAVSQLDAFLNVNEETAIPSRMLHLLDSLGAAVELEAPGAAAAAVADNLALVVTRASPAHPVRGLRIAARDSDQFSEDAFHIISDEILDDHLMTNTTEVLVQLPQSVVESDRRISFVAFLNDRAFPGTPTVNSRVVSIKIENVTHFSSGEEISISLQPTAAPGRNESRRCAYWAFDETGAGGAWAEAGCRLRRGAGGALDACLCDHLTHFAEVLVERAVFSLRDEAALRLLSTAGCGASAAGLLLVALTAALFRSWRRDFSNKVWLQLSLAVLAMCGAFLAVQLADFEGSEPACMATGVLLHYAVLASFCWMVVAAAVAYQRLVRVFAREAPHKLLRAAAFAWGAPAALVALVLAAAPAAYSRQFAEAAPAAAFCYPRGLALWLAVYAPVAAMVLVNWLLFALILRSVFFSGEQLSRHMGDSRRSEAVRCASVSCLLVFLFGLPWVFGLFAANVVAAYFFTILATFQGFVLFLFFVLGNKKTRDLWLNKLRIKQTRKVPVTSSTFTNRSTSAPRSLAPQSAKAVRDDARFS